MSELYGVQLYLNKPVVYRKREEGREVIFIAGSLLIF